MQREIRAILLASVLQAASNRRFSQRVAPARRQRAKRASAAAALAHALRLRSRQRVRAPPPCAAKHIKFRARQQSCKMHRGRGRGGRGRGRGRGRDGRRPPARAPRGSDDPWDRHARWWRTLDRGGGYRHEPAGHVDNFMMHNQTVPCKVCTGSAAPYDAQQTLSGLPDVCLGVIVHNFMGDYPGAERKDIYDHLYYDQCDIHGIRVHWPTCVMNAVRSYPWSTPVRHNGGVNAPCVCPCTACVLHHGVAHGLYGSDGWPGRVTPPWPGWPEAPDPSAAAPAPAPAAPAPAPAPAPAAPPSPEFEFMDIPPEEFERRVRAKKA
jgi:hypothetical protein